MPAKFQGTPSTHPYANHATTIYEADELGGHITPMLADAALNYGDLVFKTLGGRAGKHLNQSWYHARFMGVVVGGDLTYGNVIADPSTVGVQVVSGAGKVALIQTDGVAWVATDANSGAKYNGQNVVSGQTTAGRALAADGNLGSFVPQDVGFQIHGAASALGKTTRAAVPIISGISGTAISAADTAALSGTVNNGNFGVFEARSTGSTNQTTAHGTDASTLAGIVLPAAPAVGVATYGVIIVNPTGTGNFVGGTTALDDATVVPNAVFVQLIARHTTLGHFIDTTTANAGAAVRMRILR